MALDPGDMRLAVMNSAGQVIDRQHRPLAALTEVYRTYESLPSGTWVMLDKEGGIWPGVPSTRSDLVFVWRGPDPSPPQVLQRVIGSPGMLVNKDMRVIVPA